MRTSPHLHTDTSAAIDLLTRSIIAVSALQNEITDTAVVAPLLDADRHLADDAAALTRFKSSISGSDDREHAIEP